MPESRRRASLRRWVHHIFDIEHRIDDHIRKRHPSEGLFGLPGCRASAGIAEDNLKKDRMSKPLGFLDHFMTDHLDGLTGGIGRIG